MAAVNHRSDWLDPLLDEVKRVLNQRAERPRATYRLQFNAGFTFRDAARLVPYLHALGISHIYASPYLKARPGSPHGYDVSDHSRLNPELGGPDDYQALIDALHQHGMGQVLDVVPNHMAIATSENAWWNDVLENGPSSPYAHYFDIIWDPVKEELENKVLLPILGDQYGSVLEAGQLKLEYHEGAFFFRYFDHKLPLDPQTTIPVLSHGLEELQQALGEESEDFLEYQSILGALGYLPARTEVDPEKVHERQREKEIIKRRLHRLVEENRVVADFLARNIELFNGNPESPQSFDLLDHLLAAQAYRLSHWKAASDEINYRRFFDINELAALSMEQPDVFENTHRLVLELLVKGYVHGLRIDHIDGLYNPTEYLWRLQWAYLRELGKAAYEQGAPREPREAVAVGLVSTGASAQAPSPGADGRAMAEGPPAWEELQPAYLEALPERLGLGSMMPPAAVVFRGEMPAQSGGEPAEVYSLEKRFPANVDAPRLPLYVVVEKILGPDEPLPDEWPVAGTSGYDALNLINGLLVDPAGLREIAKLYARFLGERVDFAEVAYRSKLLILQAAMSSELHMLAHRLNQISEQHRRSRDFTLNMLRRALREVLACFPVYRTYIGPAGISERDRRFVQMAVAQARRRNPTLDAGVLDFLRDTLLLEHPPGADEAQRRQRETFVGRFQQVTSPVTAKGIEDTAFYAYVPLVSLNEVGGEPRDGAVTLEAFHRDNQERLAHRPGSLVATTTHDTKRSEDVRARLDVLSEVPHLWRAAVNRWARFNRRFRQEVDGLPAPSRNDEYLFYQSLVGIWPLERPGEAEHRLLVERLQQYMEKATREAKQRTSWINPNPPYDQAVRDFVGGVLEDRASKFLKDVEAFHERIADWGLYTALSQTLLKLTSPGIPDIYQGQELWDFSLVDPDNRRPVDFARRHRLLEELQTELAAGEDRLAALAGQLARSPRDDRLKLLVTWRTLQLRQAQPALFRHGAYLPLEAQGMQSRHVCALARRLEPRNGQAEQMVVTVAPRFLAQLTSPGTAAEGPLPPPLGPDVWTDAVLDLSAVGRRPLKDLFTGQVHLPDRGPLAVGEILSTFPVALLVGQ